MSAVIEADQRYIWRPFTQAQNAPEPISIARAKGASLYDTSGKAYLDLISSWWVNLHGHAHPVIADALADQAAKLEHVIFADFAHESAALLAKGLAKRLPGDLNRVFYSDNGSTAVEVAMKMARQYAVNQGETKRTRFLTLEGGYHGDTLGAMSAGKSSGFFDPFKPYLFDVHTLPYPHTFWDDPLIEEREAKALKALTDYLNDYADQTVAFMAEPLIQGASGMRMCRPEWLMQVCTQLREAGVLIIFDEVMTGFGRTGKLFACDHLPFKPDLIALSKGITGGFLPLSVTVATDAIYAGFLGPDFDTAFAHGHSYTANPMGCRAGVASLGLFSTENTLSRIKLIEGIHQSRLRALAQLPAVSAPRVLGDIAAFQVPDEGRAGYQANIGKQLKAAFIEKGLFIRPLGPVVYLMPPYCITEDELNRAWDGIDQVMNEFFK
jgi:adenosylmethionine---8-amino-7-oxononanoate aminotransferase